MEISDYIVVVDTHFDDFSDKVLSRINKGWKPQGGISVYRNDSKDTEYYQAMILLEDNKGSGTVSAEII